MLPCPHRAEQGVLGALSEGAITSFGSRMKFFMTSKASWARPVNPDPTDFIGCHVTWGSVNGPLTSKKAVENPSRSPANSLPKSGMDCRMLSYEPKGVTTITIL